MPQCSGSRPGLLTSEAAIESDAHSRPLTRGVLRWHLTRSQKFLVGLLAIAAVYVTISATAESRHELLRLATTDTPKVKPELSFIHDVQPPPYQKSRVRGGQMPIQTFVKDTDDSNPTMRSGIRKALIISSYDGQNQDWLDELAVSSPRWEIYRYVAPKPTTKDTPNLGREAGAYLQYIVDNYHNLSDYMIFNHGHDRSWHQPMRLLDKITTLNWTAVDQEHYINLRCTEAEGCTEDTKYRFENPLADDKRLGYKIEKFWSTSLRPQIGRMPSVIGRRCCAQFAVNKAAILHRPLVFYERLLEPLLYKNLTELRDYWGEDLPEDRFATLFEMTWHIIFGKPADHCPSRDQCNKVHFQDLIHCDGEINGYKNAAGWEKIKCTNELFKSG